MLWQAQVWKTPEKQAKETVIHQKDSLCAASEKVPFLVEEQ